MEVDFPWQAKIYRNDRHHFVDTKHDFEQLWIFSQNFCRGFCLKTFLFDDQQWISGKRHKAPIFQRKRTHATGDFTLKYKQK